MAPPRLRVLVVEDDPSIRSLVVEVLELFGYQVDAANDGAEALEAMARCRPDAIFTDLRMPRVDGLELVRVCRSDPATAAIPIAVMTARHDAERVDLPVQALIGKPFDLDEILDVARRLTDPVGAARRDRGAGGGR